MSPHPCRLQVLALGVCCIGFVGCKDRAGSQAESRPRDPEPAKVVSELGADASDFSEPTDPPAPSGNLKLDLDRFVNLETCVSERANLDPLVFDALSSLGYDTFLRDACRMLQAAKDHSATSCEKIDASSLRAKCRSWVAMVAKTPDDCPLAFRNESSRGREATCLAVASKDPRLCAGEPRAGDRTTCDAMATRDGAKCDALLPRDKAACRRELARWTDLLDAPLVGLPALTTPQAKLVLHGKDGTPDPKDVETDVTRDFEHGVVVVMHRGRARVYANMIGENEGVRFAPSPNKRARAGAIVEFPEADAGKKTPPTPTIERLELDVPGQVTIVCDRSSKSGSCDLRVTNATAERQRGGKVELSIAGSVQFAHHAYDVAFTVTSFVRDVVVEDANSSTRTFAPVHP